MLNAYFLREFVWARVA